ncbi:hypothetical protein [Paraclostridium sp. AKS81]|uniref:hypothetical protein n=1 Tax=Paraclostridium sp. AKS81 TaxID=2876117 RepID=UPI0021DF6DF6|nr:hypothetical protein [Paraclostridium sp. AKS81]MCU9810841.1 hypothetical protein [Paraclostridium sp. AKS81]
MDERILNEKKKYDKMYTDLVFAANDLKQILNSEELRKRVFIRKLDDLSGYIAFLNDLEKEEKMKIRIYFLNYLKRKII